MTTWEISAGEMRGGAGKSGVFFRSFSSRALIYQGAKTGSSPIAPTKFLFYGKPDVENNEKFDEANPAQSRVFFFSNPIPTPTFVCSVRDSVSQDGDESFVRPSSAGGRLYANCCTAQGGVPQSQSRIVIV